MANDITSALDMWLNYGQKTINDLRAAGHDDVADVFESRFVEIHDKMIEYSAFRKLDTPEAMAVFDQLKSLSNSLEEVYKLNALLAEIKKRLGS